MTPRAEAPTSIEDRVEHVLTETRMVLPGTQALLGFQFMAILTESFDQLPPLLQRVHLASFGAVALSGVLLMTPASYHRIAEAGQATERFHRFASRLLIAAMIVLALGICGDLAVVVEKVSQSAVLAVTVAMGFLALFYGLWFGLTFALRGRAPHRGERQRTAA